VGSWTSLALDQSGHPYISYMDRQGYYDGDLKYAHRDASGWHTVTVDEAGNVGRYASLALDPTGCPYISCYDDGMDNLVQARALVPAAIELTGSLTDGQLVLSWTTVPAAAAYWVYGTENIPWFVPGMAPGYEHRVDIVLPPTTTWSSPNGIGDPSANWTYLVMAVDEVPQEIARSNRCGEFDYLSDIP
jgi:hypothetical protein